ncbi:GNAT family N-acetyltransferase [Arcanobacterium hippocoleae]
MADVNLFGKFQQLTPAWANHCARFDIRNFGRDAWPETVWRSELARKDCAYLALIDPPAPHQNFGNLIALGGVGFGIEAEILTIAVDFHYRRRGIARSLISQLMYLAKNRGAAEIFLEVRSRDTGAQTLYRHLGFIAVGFRKKYYHDDDGVIMKLNLHT